MLEKLALPLGVRLGGRGQTPFSGPPDKTVGDRGAFLERPDRDPQRRFNFLVDLRLKRF